MNYSRRSFIQTAGVGSCGAFMANAAPEIFNMMASTKYLSTIGVQLYTLRNQLEKDVANTLKMIATLGYKQIELMDVVDQEAYLAIAKDLGLSVHSSFFNWCYAIGGWEYGDQPASSMTMEAVIEKAAKMELSELVFGYMYPEQRETIDQYKAIAEQLNKVGELCKKANIQLCYHNHNFEFKPIGEIVPYELLIEEMDKDLVKFELDVFWADIADNNPVKWMKKLDDRLHLLHLKDKRNGTPVLYDNGIVPENAFMELGRGTLNIRKVLKEAEKMKVKYCFVEQDHSFNPLESISMSMNYLREI